MRIKRFTAPDMRTALRMVRDEQGPDAVILSSRQAAEGGVEVVAATDYDEALVQQTLRTMNVPAVAAAAETPARTAPAPRASERAVFRIDGVEVPPLPKAALPERQASRLEQMMSAFKPARSPSPQATEVPAAAAPKPAPTRPAATPRIDLRIDDDETLQPADFALALRRAASPPPPVDTAPVNTAPLNTTPFDTLPVDGLRPTAPVATVAPPAPLLTAAAAATPVAPAPPRVDESPALPKSVSCYVLLLFRVAIAQVFNICSTLKT